jgi:ABC-2 type transport system ATP-binding protein
VAEPAVIFRSVFKDYACGVRRAKLRALDDVSLIVERGEVFGIVGPNRSGKTTIAKLLVSLCRPTVGDIRRLGSEVSDRSTLSCVGYVPETPAFPRYLNATELLYTCGALAGVSADACRARIPTLLERFEINDRAREPISRFSKGMAQRLSLAQAMLVRPKLLVLDEPEQGLDEVGQAWLTDAIVQSARDGCAVIWITHNARDSLSLCDRCARMNRGRLEQIEAGSALVASEEPTSDEQEGPLEYGSRP